MEFNAPGTPAGAVFSLVAGDLPPGCTFDPLGAIFCDRLPDRRADVVVEGSSQDGVLLGRLHVSIPPKAREMEPSTYLQRGGVSEPTSWFTSSPLFPEVVYSATETDILRSPDGGANWVVVNSDPPYFVEIHPSNPNQLFGIDRFDDFVVSTDGGATFTPTHSFGSLSYGRAIAVAPSSGNVIWVKHGEGFSKTVDGGVTWTPVSGVVPKWDPTNEGVSLAISPGDPNRVILGEGFMTTDGGVSWVTLPFAGEVGYEAAPVAYDALDPSSVVAATGTVPSSGKVWISADGGDTWSFVDSPLDYHQRVIVRANVIFVGSYSWDGVYRSDDNGQSWRLISPPSLMNLSSSGPGGLHLTSSQRLFFSHPLFGPWISDDLGRHWTAAVKGVPPASSYGLWMVEGRPSNMLIAIFGAGNEIYRTYTSGEVWQHFESPPYRGWESFSFAADGRGLANVDGAIELFESSDYGRTWTLASMNGLPAVDLFVSAVAVNGDPSLRYCQAGSISNGMQMYESSDGGDSWHPVSPGQFPSWGPQNRIDVLPDNPDVVLSSFGGQSAEADFLLTVDGSTWVNPEEGIDFRTMVLAPACAGVRLYGVSGTNQFYRRDYPGPWVPVSSALYVNLIHPSRFACNTVLSGFYNLSISYNGGASWTPTSMASITYAAKQDPVDQNRWFAVTTDGFQVSEDGGLSWLRQDSQDYFRGDFDDVTVDPCSRKFWAASEGLGLFSSEDGGNVFRQALGTNGLPMLGFNQLSIEASTCPPVFLAGRYDSLWVSRDGGAVWADSGVGEHVAHIESAGDLVVASLPARGVAVSNDRGTTFDVVDSLVDPAVRKTDIVWTPAGVPEVVSMSTNGLVQASADRGVSWQPQGTAAGPAINDFLVIQSELSGVHLIAARPDGVVVSADGSVSWQPWNDGLPAGTPVSLLQDVGSGDVLVTVQTATAVQQYRGRPGQAWELASQDVEDPVIGSSQQIDSVDGIVSSGTTLVMNDAGIRSTVLHTEGWAGDLDSDGQVRGSDLLATVHEVFDGDGDRVSDRFAHDPVVPVTVDSSGDGYVGVLDLVSSLENLSRQGEGEGE